MIRRTLLVAIILSSFAAAVHAQEPPVAATAQQQLAMLESSDPKLARNKKHVFDFWRIVYEGGHVERAPEFMAEGYIQHNPNVKSGRAAFMAYFGKERPKKPILPVMRMPVISIMAERDLVMVSHVRKVRDRANPDRIYSITWFDVFRIDAQGLIAEHWDPSEMWVDGKPPGAEFFKEWDR
jgi:predicted SnoaL-like aldol condensation-catalyzing enzyme